MEADEPDTGMRHDDTLPSVETTRRFLALCERYGSEESAVAAVVRGRRPGVPGSPCCDDWPASNAAEMRAAVDYLEQAGAPATHQGGHRATHRVSIALRVGNIFTESSDTYT